MNRTSMINVGLLLGCLTLALLYFFRSSSEQVAEVFMQKKTNTAGPDIGAIRAMLDFIPKQFPYPCEDLFKDSPAKAYNMTPAYYKYIGQYNEKAVPHGKFPVEEYRALHYMLGREFVRNVCETGFHHGCSSFYSLTASDRTVVQSFELGGNLYKKVVAEWLSSVFTTRFSIHLGNSTVSVPKFSKENPGFRCDFMYVDGGHVYPVAKADLVNFANMANLKNNIIAFDDYPPGYGNPNFGQAWEESIKEGFVVELTRCAYRDFGSSRGIVIGVVIKHPDGSSS